MSRTLQFDAPAAGERATAPARRRFLAVGLCTPAAAAGALFAVAAPATAPAEPASASPEARPRGYRVSDHVRTYYRCARY